MSNFNSYNYYYHDIGTKWQGALTYEKMLLTTKTSKPYRGSNGTAFPMGIANILIDISEYVRTVRFASTTVID